MKRRVRIDVRTASTLILLAAVLGCGRSDPFERQPLRGSLTWQGKPVKYGSVVLEPAEKQRAGAMASVRDGAFEIPRSAGPSPGKYAVWVHAFDKSGDVAPGTLPGQEGPPPKEILPDKYRLKPALEVTVERVTDEKPNEVSISLD
jgi:hypothetical protein